MSLLKIAVVASAFMSLCLTHQASMADAVIAAGSNGQVQFFDTKETAVTEAEGREAVRLCTVAGGTDCKVVATVSSNQAAVVARGSGGYRIASHADPRLAMDLALTECGKAFLNCRPDYMFWVPYVAYAAFAEYLDKETDTQHTFFAFNHGTKDGAEKEALMECKKLAKHDCTIYGSWSGKLFYAYAESKTSHGHGFGGTLENAKSAALETCRKSVGKSAVCKVSSTLHNSASTREPKNFGGVKKQITAANSGKENGNDRVNVRTFTNNAISCTNECVNGNCVRTFPDGRKERWQAPREYDVTANDWKWKTDSCGG